MRQLTNALGRLGVIVLAACAGPLALVGCQPLALVDTGTIGVTSGGPEDIARARAAIDSGWLPDPDSITVEGFLSEHDIPITPPANPPEIYGSIATTWRKPYGAATPYVDVFVSLGTTIDVASFKRRPQNLCVVVDRSGSMKDMAWSQDYRSKLEAAQEAVYALIDQLNADDRLAIESFNQDVTLEIGATSGDKKEKLAAPVGGLKARGNTDLFAAMQFGFETVAGSADSDHDSRVIVLTDALPTEGPSAGGEFTAMQRVYADQGIGFTLMGIGYYYGEELASEISRVRNGNSFFLSNAERVRQIFEEEFDYFVTPATYDLKLQLSVAPGLGIREVYGVADYTPGQFGAIIDVPTLFFSPREGGGAIIVRLTFGNPPTFEQPVSIATAAMQYKLRDGTQRQLSQEITLPAGLSQTGEPAWYSEPTAQRAAVRRLLERLLGALE
ncbi:MAG: VWA domain-containing protein [Planctomycetes bacterium]|nr:VWA domain-containing protein [Planctomycetota bacterium]